MEELTCPQCGEALDYLDTVINKETGVVAEILYVCHNEECACFCTIYHENTFGDVVEGDPTGMY